MGSSVEENDENFFGSLELVETAVFRRSRDRKAWRERESSPEQGDGEREREREREGSERERERGRGP